MPSLNLNGEKLERLSDAIRDAFSVQRLREMLKFKLSKRLDDISLGSDYKEIVFELITQAESEGWTAELVVGARQSVPGNALMQAFAEEVALAASAPTLERTIKAQNPYLDVNLFRTRLGEIEAQVCRIEIPTARGTVFGTGFLLGPDVLMTNYHVMEPVITGKAKPDTAVFRFDYKRLSGATVNNGTVFALAAADWLIDSSPPSAIDSKPEPKPGVPNLDELDYAIVRLQGSPGSRPVGDKPEKDAAPRGWIPLAQAAAAVPASPMLIMQHPDGAPLKLALDMSGVLGPNPNNTRVKYSVNTEGGSSGSPCFNTEWNLVALHHSGDPNFDSAHKPEYNEGIPIDAIVKLLTTRGKRDQIGGGT